MYLETEFSSPPASTTNPGFSGTKFLLISIIVIIQSIIFSVMSSEKYQYFFYLFAAVVCVDVVGFTLLGRSETAASFRLERGWILNNLFSVIALLLLFLLIFS
ncbi:hypothetical protein [Mastigocladopsis repens]|uniref:hypothetical protein n=1 Tax=Mastigocladopsis repens TaxID=221287 RepID=UPI0002EF63AF|nr:hypothetical protein [Mastigocladopsis repens]